MLIKYDQRTLRCRAGETVLDCLLRAGIDLSHRCKNGVCQCCMLRACKGDPGVVSQMGLRPSRVAQNYFLPCQCVPHQDLEIDIGAGVGERYQTRLLSREKLSADIYRLRLSTPPDYHYRGGQYLSVYHPNGGVRHYSIASLPGLPYLELHVQHYAQGLLSQWLCCELQPTQSVEIGVAEGDCYYQENDNLRPLLLMASGCGMAPIYAVLQEALTRHHASSIHLYHGSSRHEGLYLIEEIRALALQTGFDYQVSLSKTMNCNSDSIRLSGSNAAALNRGRITDMAFSRHRSLHDWSVYLCGGERFVKTAQKSAFLAGAALSHIHVDAFLASV